MKRWFQGSSSQSPQPPPLKRPKLDTAQVRELNASLYELYSPPGTPSMEVLFFHGFQHGDYDEAHLSAWTCGDGSGIIWPQTWLVKKFCDARILTVSYNANALKTQESFDVYNIGENLISDLLDAKVGQHPRCPVILVGHSFGGLVIKQLCVDASSEIGSSESNSSRSSKLKSFLQNVKGIFFYSTPHYGIADNIAEHFVENGPLLEYVKILSLPTARLNYRFEKLYGQGGQYPTWEIAAVGESLSTKSRGFDGQVVVREASSRYGSDFNLVEGADHMTVCRPMNETSRSFRALKNFLDRFSAYSKVVVPTHQCHGLPSYPTGLTRRANEIQEMLETAQVIAIVGMGGIGKTTLAKEVFNSISRDFEYTCFANNVKGIQDQDLDDWLLRHFHRNGTKVDGNKIQWCNLMHTKSLIVLDDVTSETQIRHLPRLDHFGNGTRLIFTTRIQSVFDTVPNVVIYEVDFLDFDEAKELFCLHAFQQEGIPDDLLEVNHHLEAHVKKVVQKCDGLPLTLEVMGSYLKIHKTNARVWEETLDKLGKAQSVDGRRNDRVWSSLRVSYDALSPEEQGMFIEAGTFFFEQPVERALAAWSTAFQYSESRWVNLLRTSMVKEVDKTEWDIKWERAIKYKEVWVHEQLRDLAKHLSKGAIVSRSVGECHRAVDLLHANAVKAQTSIIRLHYKDLLRENYSKLRLELLNEMQKLKYVELVDVLLEGSRGNLLTNLSILKWNRPKERFIGGYRIEMPPILLPVSLERMNNLAILELDHWKIPEESLEALGKLNNLRILSLSHIQGLAHLPENFGCLSQLKCFDLKSVSLTSLSPSFGDLSALERLLLDDVDVVELPESFGNLSSLKTLVIARCHKLASLPESFACLLSLEDLVITDCSGLGYLQPTESIQVVSRKNLSALKSLRLERCTSLETLPACFGLLSSLEELDLDMCTELKTLPGNFDQFKALKRLSISHADHLEALPDSFGRLTALTYLCLYTCRALKRLPVSFGNLSALRKLDLLFCDQLGRLPGNFCQLRGLEALTISDAGELKALPDDFGKLPSLTLLRLSCGGLKRLPESFGLLSTLQELHLVGCEELQKLPDNFGLLCALQTLLLNRCTQLQRLPGNFGKLRGLEDLRISHAGELEALSDDFGKLPSLTLLKLSCRGLKRLPDSFGLLSSLQQLHLVGCEKLQRLPYNFGRLCALQKLRLSKCTQLQRLPDNFGQLGALQKLAILSADSLEALPKSFCGLSALQELHLDWCVKLQRLPDNFGQLSSLESLVIECADDLDALPNSLGDLSSLEQLFVSGQRLQSLPRSIGNLQSLRKLQIYARHLRSLPEELGDLSSLEVLKIHNCQGLMTLPNSLRRISSLIKITRPTCSLPTASGGLYRSYRCPLLVGLHLRREYGNYDEKKVVLGPGGSTDIGKTLQASLTACRLNVWILVYTFFGLTGSSPSRLEDLLSSSLCLH